MNSIELFIGVLNLIGTIFVTRSYKTAQLSTSEQEQNLRDLLNQKEDYKQAEKKLWIITIGGLIASVFRAARAIGAHILIKTSDDYVCKQGMYFYATTNVTEIFVWYSFIVNFIPTILLFYVVYFMPRRSGQISKLNRKKHKVNYEGIDIDGAMGENSEEINPSSKTENFFHSSESNEAKKTDGSLENFLTTSYSPSKKKSTRRKDSVEDSYDIIDGHEGRTTNIN
jgi:hypothetical protein